MHISILSLTSALDGGGGWLTPRLNRFTSRSETGCAPEEVADVAHILWLQVMVHVISHDNGVVLIIIIIIIIITGPSGRQV